MQLPRLLLLSATRNNCRDGTLVQLKTKAIQATPNHPMLTGNTQKKMGELQIGDQVICLDEAI